MNQSPEEIARDISEEITPGTLGLSVLAELAGGTGQKQGEEPLDVDASMANVANLAGHISRFADELAQYAKGGDVRQARLSLIELLGAVSQSRQEVDKLAVHYGLPQVDAKG